ncbi:MAG: TVP38/TMEM64 family protein [Myxococcaceae bacterium]|nr:TVP38/TMEM64 family protein [Myxococcaceae bacterium]
MTPERKKQLFKAATILIPIVVVGALWLFTPLNQFRKAEDVANALRAITERPFGWALVPLGFALGAVLFVPVNALVVGVALSFDPLRGFTYAMTGGMLASMIAYGLGKVFATSVIELMRGPKVDKFIDKLRENPFRASLLLHLMPIGNFTAVNMLAGALKVPFFGFLLGTFLGLMPGVLFFTLLGGQLPKLMEGSVFTFVTLGLGVLATVGIGLLIRKWMKQGSGPAAA